MLSLNLYKFLDLRSYTYVNLHKSLSVMYKFEREMCESILDS